MITFSRALMTGVVSLALMSCQATPAPTPVVADKPVAATPVAEAPPAPAHDIVAPAPKQEADAMAGHPGEAVYKQYCAVCHDQPEATRSPAKSTLKQMSLQFINFALTQGKMKAQGSPLSA